MEIDRILKEIEKELRKNNIEYFSYAWREKIINFLEDESRYSKLVEWIDNKIEFNRKYINVFNPADKTESYTNEFFKNYMEALKDFAFLINMKLILLDEKSTTKMRENIEYTICKLYNIKF